MIEMFHKKMWLGILLILPLSACKTPTYVSPGTAMKAYEPSKIILGPGDIIEVKFFYTPQLDGIHTIRPDGKIQLQLVGEVQIAGYTPAEFQELLKKLYKEHLKNPEVAVMVQSLQNHRVFVGGEVEKPGALELTGNLNVVEAIFQAGGFRTQGAHLENVVVIRHRDNKRYGYSLNLKPMLEEASVSPPFMLEPEDIVFVPRTRIDKLNQWIDQYITKMIPQTGFTYSVPSGTARIGLDTSR